MKTTTTYQPSGFTRARICYMSGCSEPTQSNEGVCSRHSYRRQRPQGRRLRRLYPHYPDTGASR